MKEIQRLRLEISGAHLVAGDEEMPLSVRKDALRHAEKHLLVLEALEEAFMARRTEERRFVN